MFDFPAGATPGQIFEPGGPGTEPAYTFDGIGWNYGAVANLLISSLVPNAAICGSAGPLLVRALGANYTATCEILIDGVATPTTFVSVSELTFNVDPSVQLTPLTVVVTVRDGANIGAGAVPFSYRVVTTYDFRIGIDETSPGIIDVLPANTIGELGGVTLQPRSATQGLEYDIATALVTAPLATPLLAGAILEPPDDSKGYVRQTTGASSTWVPPATTPLPDFGTGLTLDTSTDPDIVHLQPAGPAVSMLGGVYVPSPDRSLTQGLLLNPVDGHLSAPLATDLLAGSIVEPLPDALRYVRTRDAAGVSTWVPEATTDYGLGLSLDQSAVPPIVHLQPAGPQASMLGGVYVPTPDRSLTQGLALNPVDGLLQAPLATDLLAGSIVEPPPDDIQYLRARTTAGVSAWVRPAPVPLAIGFIIPNTAPTGSAPLTVEVHGVQFTATTRVIVDGAAKVTSFVSPTELTFQLDPLLETVRTAIVTVQNSVGPVNGLGDAPFHFVPSTALYRGTYSPVGNLPDIWAGRQLNYMYIVDLVDPMIPEFSGVPGLAGIALNEGDHLVYDGTQYRVVDGNQTLSLYQGWWKPATNVPDIGAMVKYTGFMWIADTAIPTTPETPPLGLPGLDGVAIYEGDMILWDGAKFVLMQGVLTPNYRGLWNVATNTPPIDQPAVGNNKPNWMWLAKTVDPNVPEVAPATIPGIGGLTIVEGDHIIWDKPNAVFIRVSGGPMTDFGIGLSAGPGADPGDPRIVHLTPAGDSPATLGGVYVIDRVRNNIEGLELGADGRLRVPPATDALLGGILEPPADDKGYVRRRTPAGVSAWVPPADGGAVKPAGDTKAEIGVVFVPARTDMQALTLDVDGQLTSLLATHQLAGAIVEPPNDGNNYVRTRTPVGVSSWVPSVAGVFIGDDPPPSPTVGMLWFESDTGDMHVWYQDVDSAQWVQF